MTTLTTEQLEIVREALGDAWAYRTDSGENGPDGLSPEDQAICARYLALADQLGLTLDY